MMCEYCEDDNMLGTSEPGYEGIEAKIKGSELAISGWYDGCAGISPLYIPINYCPMCGKKLGDTNE